MKIGFIVPSLAIGGQEKVVINLANHMANVLHMDVTIITFYRATEEYTISQKVNRITINLFPVVSLYKKPFLLIKRAINLRCILDEYQFDMLYSFSEGANIPAILTGYDLYISVRQPVSRIKLTHRAFYFLYKMKRVKKIVVQTIEMQKNFLRLGYSNTVVIPNPIEDLVYYSKNIINFHNIMQGKYFFAAGRLSAEKNFLFLIEAFAKSAIKEDYSLFIAGSGKQRENLETAVKKRGLENKVIFLGLQDEATMDYLYKNAYATILSSNYEGYPNVLIESLARGTPVISTNCPYGPAEIVIQNINGLLVPPSNVDAMTRAINNLAKNHFLRKKLSMNAKQSVDHLRMDKISKKWLVLDQDE